jgi:hypothetical protein
MRKDHSYREPSLKDFLHDLKNAWLFILTGGIIGALSAFIFIKVAVPQYRAQMLIGPTSETSSADVTALLGQFDLPNLQYIVRRPGPSESADFVRFENILTRASVADRLIEQKPALLKQIEKDRDFLFQDKKKMNTPANLSEYLQRELNHYRPEAGRF